MNAKVAVAQEIVAFCKTRENYYFVGPPTGDDVEVLAQFREVREAFEAVIAAAAASQTPPADFKQGEPGVAQCNCEACQFDRFRLQLKGTAT